MSPSSAASKPSFESFKGFSDAPAMTAVRESTPWSLAGFAAGLLFLLVAHVPISKAVIPALALASPLLAAVLAYRLAVKLQLNRWIVVCASVGVLALIVPRPLFAPAALAYLQHVGGSGLFLGIISAALVCLACVVFRKATGHASGADTAASVIALGVAAFVLALHFSIGDAIVAALHPLTRLGDTIAALLLIAAVETLLFLFGIHGPATLAAVVTPLYLTLQAQNTDAFSMHRSLPHVVVVSTFLFVFPGGAGATLPLAAYFALSKVQRLRAIGRVAIVPAIFNINEPLLFGAPIVANPFFAVPFVGVPLVLAAITYFAMTHGLVAKPAFYMPSGVPSLVSTFSATLDWRAPVLMAINITIAAAAYWPFFRAYERASRDASAQRAA